MLEATYEQNPQKMLVWLCYEQVAGPSQIVMGQQWSQTGMEQRGGVGVTKPRGYKAVVMPDQRASPEKLLKLLLVEFPQYLREAEGQLTLNPHP